MREIDRAIPELGEEGGGGVNPSSRGVGGDWLNWFWDEDFTKVLDHLSPEAGGTCSLQKKVARGKAL